MFSLIQGAATQLQYWICTENLILNVQIICHQTCHIHPLLAEKQLREWWAYWSFEDVDETMLLIVKK